jgi:hypothetical protein
VARFSATPAAAEGERGEEDGQDSTQESQAHGCLSARFVASGAMKDSPVRR